MKAVTSFSREGYEAYGRRFLETYVENWEIPIHVYYEGEKPDFEHDLVIYHDLFQVDGAVEFLSAISGLPIFAGIINGKRNYRYDLFTFCRKIFAQHDAARDYGGKLFWIDADTEFDHPVTQEYLEGLFEGHFMVYLGRTGWDHSCASFIGWDNGHEHAQAFWEAYVSTVLSGQVFLLEQWHDSFILDVIRKHGGISAKNLLEGVDMPEGPVNVFDIFGLGHHKKGAEKFGPKRYRHLVELVRQLQPGRILEIGTWNGERAAEMVRATGMSAEYVGFDLFEAATDETDQTEKNVKPHVPVEAVSRFLNDAGVNHFLYGGFSRDTLPRYIEEHGENSADFIFIDGGHSVGTIEEDFENAMDAVKPGGVIAFDDYYTDMPEEELDRWGANRVVDRICSDGLEVYFLPEADPVQGGGKTSIAVVEVPEVGAETVQA